MKETESILQLYRGSRERRVPMVLATVVNKSGSAYRRPGARMLVAADGQSAGSISGGCVERDLIERATEISTWDVPRLLTYRAEHGDPYDFGSGCEGVIYTLVEPLRLDVPSENVLNSDIFSAHRNSQTAESAFVDPIEVLETVHRNRCIAYSATVFSAPEKRQDMVGRRVVQFHDGAAAVGGAFDNSGLFVEIMIASTKLFSKGPAFTKFIDTAEGTFGVFFEKIEPPTKLVIFGAGDDAVPLASFASVLGLAHSIVDHRPGLMSEERFPAAEQLMRLRPEQYPLRLSIDQFTACVVMHHNYDSDKEVVRFLLEGSATPYIGVLGPKRRSMRILSEIRHDRSSDVIDSRRSSLFAPVGLDIGAETPEEIALSIVAEITTYFKNKAAHLLRDKDGPIHDAFARANGDGDNGQYAEGRDGSDDGGSVEYIHLQCRI
jgi:xanthine dehydrogenase accessory factor